MAFVTKTWKDRLVEFAGRRKLKNVSTNEEVLYDVSRSEGTVMQAGDSFNATNMNDLEQRIKTEFDNVNSSLIDSNTSETFNFGSLNGVRGFFTNPSRADDSFIPFKSGANYVFFDESKYGQTNSYTFNQIPDKAYLMWGASSGGSIPMTGIQNPKNIWQFAGEGYWNGAFYTVTVEKTVTFSKSNVNRAFVLLFW